MGGGGFFYVASKPSEVGLLSRAHDYESIALTWDPYDGSIRSLSACVNVVRKDVAEETRWDPCRQFFPRTVIVGGS